MDLEVTELAVQIWGRMGTRATQMKVMRLPVSDMLKGPQGGQAGTEEDW